MPNKGTTMEFQYPISRELMQIQHFLVCGGRFYIAEVGASGLLGPTTYSTRHCQWIITTEPRNRFQIDISIINFPSSDNMIQVNYFCCIFCTVHYTVLS